MCLSLWTGDGFDTLFRKSKTNGGIFPHPSAVDVLKTEAKVETMGPEPPDVIAAVRSNPTTRRVWVGTQPRKLPTALLQPKFIRAVCPSAYKMPLMEYTG